jgi:GntR family transcriptional regulator
VVPSPRRQPPPSLPRELVEGVRKGEQLQDMLESLASRSEPGSALPSERELADRYGVARMTVRGAIDGLVARGLVYRVHGQGTFVSERRFTQPAALTSFSEDMAARGLAPTSLVLAQERVPAPEPIALALELGSQEEIVRIERIRLGDGEPIALERTHLPARRFPGLEHADLSARSLYGHLAERYGCSVATSQQRITAVRLTPTEAHLLRADRETPALDIHRVTRCAGGELVEYVRSLYRGDRYELFTTTERPSVE